MTDIKKFFFHITIFIFIISFLCILLLVITTQISTLKFRTSYQYAINLKYEHLINTKSPKIIFIGGSTVGFGIDNEILEEKLHMPVVNLGLHRNLGMEFITELSKANIEKGDIVVLAYEYRMLDDMEFFSPELIASAIDNHLQLYRYVSFKQWGDLLRYFPTYLFKKVDSLFEDKNDTYNSGVYSISAFDDDGNMIYPRESCILPEELTETHGEVDLKKITISKNSIDYINAFSDYVHSKGASIVFTFSPILEERFYRTDEDIKAY